MVPSNVDTKRNDSGTLKVLGYRKKTKTQLGITFRDTKKASSQIQVTDHRLEQALIFGTENYLLI